MGAACAKANPYEDDVEWSPQKPPQKPVVLDEPAFEASPRAADKGPEPLVYENSCFFPTTFLQAPLLRREPHAGGSQLLTFGLPAGKALDLPCCGALLAQGGGSAKPYTPISAQDTVGEFTLAVKVYPDGTVSKALGEVAVGGTVGFKHLGRLVSIAYGSSGFDGVSHITMLAAGSGITPCYQAILKCMTTAGDSTTVTLLYGSKTDADIMLRSELDALAATAGERLTVVHTLSGEEKEGFENGWIDQEKIERLAPPPAEDGSHKVFVCGLPAMYEALCGARGEPLADGSVLAALGHSASNVVKL